METQVTTKKPKNSEDEEGKPKTTWYMKTDKPLAFLPKLKTDLYIWNGKPITVKVNETKTTVFVMRTTTPFKMAKSVNPKIFMLPSVIKFKPHYISFTYEKNGTFSTVLTVFPDPVCAHAIKSLPARIAGIEYFCTGVGFTYFAFSTLVLNVS